MEILIFPSLIFPSLMVQVELDEETVGFVIEIFSVSECNVTGKVPPFIDMLILTRGAADLYALFDRGLTVKNLNVFGFF